MDTDKLLKLIQRLEDKIDLISEILPDEYRKMVEGLKKDTRLQRLVIDQKQTEVVGKEDFTKYVFNHSVPETLDDLISRIRKDRKLQLSAKVLKKRTKRTSADA